MVLIKARPLGQPRTDLCTFVNGVVVLDQVEIQVAWNRLLDLTQVP